MAPANLRLCHPYILNTHTEAQVYLGTVANTAEVDNNNELWYGFLVPYRGIRGSPDFNRSTSGFMTSCCTVRDGFSRSVGTRPVF